MKQGLGYAFEYPSHRLVYVPIPRGNTCINIAEAMKARGTHGLIVAPDNTED